MSDEYIEGYEDGRKAALAEARDDKVLVLKQVRAIIDTLPPSMGHGAVNLLGVLDIIDDAIRRVILRDAKP